MATGWKPCIIRRYSGAEGECPDGRNNEDLREVAVKANRDQMQTFTRAQFKTGA